MARPRERKGRRGILAERLRAARAARGLTQHAAASELGILQTVLARYESAGRRPAELSLRYLNLWCSAALGEPIDLPGFNPRTGP